MRITTWNVNGLRAALRKGFASCLDRLRCDVLLLQEIRVLPEQLPAEWQQPADWHVVWHPAEKKGYAGTAVWSRSPMENVTIGMGEGDVDTEGRLITVEVEGVRISSVYLPSGSSGAARQQFKEAWMTRFAEWSTLCVDDSKPCLLGGDFNIAHTPQDIFYAKSNARTSGFMPHERQWLSDFLSSGWCDLVREHYGDMQGPYSWWSNRGRARELDRGWRIDYLFGNSAASGRVLKADIDRESALSVSDHAPVTVELK